LSAITCRRFTIRRTRSFPIAEYREFARELDHEDDAAAVKFGYAVDARYGPINVSGLSHVKFED
jgi:hypothetical protein